LGLGAVHGHTGAQPIIPQKKKKLTTNESEPKILEKETAKKEGKSEPPLFILP
jgi:hypothetical protein